MWEVTEKYESIKNCTYYDLLAFLCWAISNLDDYQRKGLYKDFTKNYASIMDRRCTRFSFLTAKGTQGPIKYDALTSQMYLELQELFVAEETADWPMILAVAVQIDTIIEYEPNLRDFTRKRPVFDVSGVKCPPVDMKPIDVSNYFYSLNSLNPKTDSTFGEVLPRIPHRWARAETRSLASVQMNPLSYLKNYMWLPPSNTEWIVEHLLIQPINRNNRATKIITSPLSCQAPFLIEKKEDSYFNIKYIDEGSRQITSRIKSITDAAIAKQADIVVFPEMLATLECVAQCSDYFRRRTGKKCPYLFMLPTIEYQRNGKWVNQLIALDADGYCVFGYNKQHPFILESKDKGGKGEKLKFYEPIEKESLTQIKYMLDIIWEQYVIRFNPELKIEPFGNLKEEEISEIETTLEALAFFCVVRTFSYEGIVSALKYQLELSDELTEHIAKRIDRDYRELQINFLIKKMDQFKIED